MPEQIKLIFLPDGKVRIEALGFSGASCEEATAALELLFGAAGERIYRPEFYEETHEQHHQRQ